jgi:hypothetical protein
MGVEVRNPDPVRVHDIEIAAKHEWPFNEWNCSEADKRMISCAEGSLCNGEGEEIFTNRLTKAVWKANRRYCTVIVSAACLDDLPINFYELKKDDFASWSKAEGNQLISDASSDDTVAPSSKGGN